MRITKRHVSSAIFGLQKHKIKVIFMTIIIVQLLITYITYTNLAFYQVL